MVVNQVHVHGVCTLKAPDNAPVGTDGDRLETAQVVFQRMQPEAWQVHVFRRFGPVQHGKDVFDLVEHVGPDLRPVSAFKKPFQTAMPEAPYHCEM
jgi:hypothetical protein